MLRTRSSRNYRAGDNADGNKGRSSFVRKLAVLVIVMMLVNSEQRQIFWMLINILGSPVAANVMINTKN
jgi:hypothetical protein